MSVWNDNKKGPFPLLFSPLHYALLNASALGHGEQQRKAKTNNLSLMSQLIQLIYWFEA